MTEIVRAQPQKRATNCKYKWGFISNRTRPRKTFTLNRWRRLHANAIVKFLNACLCFCPLERAKDAHMVNVNDKGVKIGWKRERSGLGQFKCI